MPRVHSFPKVDAAGTFLLVLGLLSMAPLTAQDAPPREIVVGVKDAPPFAMRDATGTWSGISVELVKDIGARLGLVPRFVERDLTALLADVAKGEIDVGAAALTVTAARERTVDFSHSYMDSGLGIAVPLKPGSAWSAALGRFLSLEFLSVVATLVGVLLIAGVLVWLFERRKNPEQFGGQAGGLWEGFWWAAVTMTTVGYGDKAPQTSGGRIVALTWMFGSIIIISSFTAAITSSLTVSRLESSITGPDDLSRARAATVEGSTSLEYLRRNGVSTVVRGSLAQALELLEQGTVDCVVYDAPLLRYRIHESHPSTLEVLPMSFERQQYALSFPEGSRLREPFNRVLLEILGSPEWTQQLQRYFGS